MITMTATETEMPAPGPSNYQQRVLPTMKLKDLRKSFEIDSDPVVVDTASIEFSGDERVLKFKGKKPTAKSKRAFVAPLTTNTLNHLGTWLGLPATAFRKWPNDVQAYMTGRFIGQHQPGEVVFEINDHSGIVDIRKNVGDKVDPRRVVDVAAKVLGEDADVLEGWRDAKGFLFDVVVPAQAKKWTGGDPAVGDITRGGLRFWQSFNEPLRPQLSRYMYRVTCTNGMEIPETFGVNLTKVESVAGVMKELEAQARLAMADMESHIADFYKLRDVPVTDPEQLAARIGRERNLPSSVMLDMIERMPLIIEDLEEATLFDVVNVVTNQANHPSLAGKHTTRRHLELAGGRMLTDHSKRCTHCQSQLVE
jgi:hypothetical protein